MKWKKNSLGKLLPKEEDEDGVVEQVGVVLQRPQVVLRRGGGASMVGKMGELLHGLELEREGEGSEWDEGESARGALVEEGAWLTRGVGVRRGAQTLRA